MERFHDCGSDAVDLRLTPCMDRLTDLSKTEFKIRPATSADASAIERLAGEFANYLHGLGDPTVFHFNATACLRDGFGKQPHFGILLAEQGDQTIGYLLYHFGYDTDLAAPNLHIQDLCVASEDRGRGVGRALMAAAARLGREAGAAEMVWAVLHQNTAAFAFYEKLGAKRITNVAFLKLSVDSL